MPTQDELKVLIKAYDEFTATFERYRQQLTGVAQAQQKAGQAGEQAGKQIDRFRAFTKASQTALLDFYYVLGSLGALYGFQRAIQQVIDVGRQFEATITQAKLIVGDMTSTLEDAAMAAQGSIFGPQQLAEMYRELGAAGLNAQEVMQAAPDVLDFATAAMIDQVSAAEAVIAAVRAFRMSFEDTQRITDAFTEAMNRTTLGGKDLVYALASIGPVAGQAGQSLEQTLAAVAALKDAGASAQDAATSVRSAMMHLSAPSNEAQKMMEALGVKIWDASGAMKQWGDIVAEFERALAGLTKQQEQEYLATIFGTDGIRAITASMALGSRQVNELARAFADAEGTTEIFASTMADTLDGALRRTQGNLERLQVLISQDVEPVIRSLIDWINNLIVGFNNLDDNTRKFVEYALGATGIVAVLGIIGGVIRSLLPILSSFGITVAALTSPLALLAYAVGGVVTAIVGYKIEQAAAGAAAEQQKEHLSALANAYFNQKRVLEDTNLSAEQYLQTNDQLNETMKTIGRIMPEMVTAWNEHGEAIALAEDRLRSFTQTARFSAEQMAYISLGAAEMERDLAQAALRQAQVTYTATLHEMGQYLKEMEARGTPLFGGSAYVERRLGQVKGQLEALQRAADAAEARVQAAQKAVERLSQAAAAPPPAGRTIQLPGREKEGKAPTWLETWRVELQAYLDTLSGFEAATTRAAEKVNLLSARQQYLTRVIESGKGGLAEMMDLEVTRAEVIDALTKHQAELHREADAYRQAIAELEARQGDLNLLFAEGKITQEDYTQASRTLQNQIEDFNRQIAANSQAWWQNEQAILDAKLASERLFESQRDTIMGLLRQAYQWEEKETLAHYQEMYEAEEEALQARIDAYKKASQERLARIEEDYRAEEEALQARIDALGEASVEEIRLQEQIDAIDEELAVRRRLRDEEEERRRIEQLRGQVESSRMVVVEQGLRRVTHDMEKERQLQEAEAEAAFNAEVRRLEDQRKLYQEQLQTLKDRREQRRKELQNELKDLREAHRQELEAMREAAEERQGQLEQELRDMQKSHRDKLDALREYYDAMAQDTLLRQQAQLEIEQQGYEASKAAYEQYLREMEQLRARQAEMRLGELDLSVPSLTSGGGGGRQQPQDQRGIDYNPGSGEISWEYDDGSRQTFNSTTGEATYTDAEGNTYTRNDGLPWGLAGGGLVRGLTLTTLGERGAEVVLPLERAVPVLSEALLGAMDNIAARMRPQAPIVVQAQVAREVSTDSMDVEARSLVIQAQTLYIQVPGGRAAVDVLAQMGYRR